MRNVLNTDLIYEVLSVVEEIPEGCVTTYGRIARLTGRHRVVNHAGRTTPGFHEQKQLLEAEGVRFRANGCVDLAKYQWDC